MRARDVNQMPLEGAFYSQYIDSISPRFVPRLLLTDHDVEREKSEAATQRVPSALLHVGDVLLYSVLPWA